MPIEVQNSAVQHSIVVGGNEQGRPASNTSLPASAIVVSGSPASSIMPLSSVVASGVAESGVAESGVEESAIAESGIDVSGMEVSAMDESIDDASTSGGPSLFEHPEPSAKAIVTT